MMTSVWTNPTAIFILIGAWMMEQSQVKHELLFCARVLLGEYTENFLIKKSLILECLLVGVPQGSMLGPILFLLYIYNINDNTQNHILLFADNCLVYRVIHTPQDHDTLQKNLNNLTIWARHWHNMEFNRHC